MYITNDEKELEEVDVEGDVICFKSKPYSYTTLKAFGDFNISEN